MTEVVLTKISPVLVTTLRALDPPTLRMVTARACALAVRSAGLDDARVFRALGALEAGSLGDDALRSDVHACTEELDEAAWDIQERVETGNATGAEYHVAFARARAASAVDQAFGADPSAAAFNAFYEAHFAIDNIDELLTAVESIR
jgi:hypothetical protein